MTAETRPSAEHLIQYRPDIDGLRAVAVLAVIGFHAGAGPSGGFAGVDVFFVISGFLITSLIARSCVSGDFGLAQFWMRRIRRIGPALALMTAVVAVLGVLALPPSPLRHLGSSIRALGLIWSNFHFARGGDYFDPATDVEALLHTWSLAVEEQFYLLLPPVLMVCLAPAAPARRAFRVMAACAGVSLLLALAGSLFWPTKNFYFPFGRFWELLLGSLVALWAPRAAPSRWARECVAMLGLGGIAAAYMGASGESLYPGAAALAPTVGTAMVIWSGSHGDSVVGRALSVAPLRWVGLISYSLYLWHWPALVFLRICWQNEPSPVATACAVGIAVCMSVLAWRCVERPFRSSKALGTPRAAFIFWGTVSALFVLAGSIMHASRGLPQRPWMRAGATTASAAWDVPSRLMHPVDAPWKEMSQLPRLGNADCERSLDFLIWGDSHGMAISEALQRSAARVGACGRAALRTGTPPLLGAWRGGYERGAIAWNDQVLSCIQAARPPHVLLIARWSASIDGSVDAGTSRVLMDETVAQPDPRVAPEVAARALRATVEAITAAGAQCWILLEVPIQDLTPTQIRTRKWLGVIGTWSDVSLDRTTHERHVASVRHLVRGVSNVPGVHVLDLAEACFANSDHAPAGGSDGPYYVDRNHLNDSGAEGLLGATFDRLLQQLMAHRLATSEDPPSAAARP